jgi:hypothetical protein
MESNELRLGNLITFLGETVEVECISNLPKRKDMYWIKPKGSLIAKEIHFRPIPLTEEWLLNLGFDKGSDIMGDCYYIDELNVDFALHHYNRGLDFVYNFYDLNVKYVHQLQNLYFALTGKELKQL